jgi:hypothetical protein
VSFVHQLIDVKGAFDRVDKTQLLQRMMQVGIAGNIVRWVDSFLSNRRAMLVIDGRTGDARAIQAGLPQGSPVSPVLFILSVSALFQWLEDRHPALQAISFVDDIGLVIECDELEKGTARLERIARDAMQWGADNKVEFEVSKTEVLLFSRRKKVLQAARSGIVRIGEQSFAIKQEATKWLGFWLDPKLSFKAHFENRMASARGALHRVASLSRSNAHQPDAESGGCGSDLRSTARLGSLVEGPTRSCNEVTALIEQPSESYHRLAAVDAADLPPGSNVPTLRKGSP